jgi:hypothetical protein
MHRKQVLRSLLLLSMLEYGEYQDKGVRGKEASPINTAKSPFRFGSGTGRKGGLTEAINKWVRARRFQFRDDKGQVYELRLYGLFGGPQHLPQGHSCKLLLLTPLWACFPKATCRTRRGIPASPLMTLKNSYANEYTCNIYTE